MKATSLPTLRACALAAALLLGAYGVEAQLTVGATLPPASPSGGSVRSLLIGPIIPLGRPLRLDVRADAAAPGDAVPGEFRFDVSHAEGIEYVLNLPATLTAEGGSTLSISFAGPQYGAACTESESQPCVPVNFDPRAGPFRVCRSYNGASGTCRHGDVFPAGTTVRIFVGGFVASPDAPVTTTYAGTVTLTVFQVH